MGINDVIIYIMTFFLVVGAIDRILGNKFGYGQKFEEGIEAMGGLALSMIGIVSLAPVLANILRPVVVPVYEFLGADPSMFATTLLALDMGGYPLALELAKTAEAGLFSGIILGAMMGPTIVFTIPVALGIIQESDHKYLATGILAGIITIPIGAFVGGLVAGFPVVMVLKNLIPIVIVSLLLAFGLWKKPEGMTKGFIVFGKGVVALITIGLAAIAIETLTGFVVIPGLAPLSEGVAIVGDIAIMLAGAFPLVHFITKVFKKPLMKLGNLLGIGEVAATGLVSSLANNIPMFDIMKDMDNRGKIINVAFAVSASFVFGDHLGFAAGVERQMIFPMIVGKLVGGITAIMLAMYVCNKTLPKEEAK